MHTKSVLVVIEWEWRLVTAILSSHTLYTRQHGTYVRNLFVSVFFPVLMAGSSLRSVTYLFIIYSEIFIEAKNTQNVHVFVIIWSGSNNNKNKLLWWKYRMYDI